MVWIAFTQVTAVYSQTLEKKGEAPVGAAQKVVGAYRQPKIGAPDLRELLATRGSKTGDQMQVTLLVPTEGGKPQPATTLRASPALYWHQSKASEGRLEVSVTDVAAGMPVFKFRNKGTTPAGLNSIDLEKHKVVLQPGRTYKWSVICYIDRNNPSANIVESAGVIRQAADSVPDGGNWQSTAEQLATAGAWYDVTDVLVRACATGIEGRSPDPEAQEALKTWLNTFSIKLAAAR